MSILKTPNFTLTYEQCKEIVEAGHDLIKFAVSINDQPSWIKHMGVIEDVSELKAILEDGCASGAYMPAVTYSTAWDTFCLYGDDIVDFLTDHYWDDVIEFDLRSETNQGFAVKLCSLAVELWVMQFADVIDAVETY